jgi:cyclophilin family peptidyl-prolyl cis-trans isomerase
MADNKKEKAPDNELDIHFGVDTLVILGRIDCPKLTHCRALISNILDKITSKNMQTHFVICFETQFESLRNYLLKQNLGFIDYPDSPIIYIQKVSGEKDIIGSLNEFQKYVIKEFNYHDTLKTEEFVEETKRSLKSFLDTNGNKYVFFDFSIEGEEESTKNRVVLELFNKDLPLTSDNFFKLCTGCKNEEGTALSYKGSLVHRISKNSFIQSGDIRIDGAKSIYGENFNDENYNIKHDSHGILGMVKKGNRKHTNECQFYITLCPLKSFDGILVAFGRVIQGYDVIEKISEMDTYLQRPVKQVSIKECGEFTVQ